MHKPLDGMAVLDLTRIISGPFCAMMLGDLGAEVIKVERIDGGDDARLWGPPFRNGETPHFLSYNRGKKSLTLDIQKPAGKRILSELVKQSDVLIENFRPGVIQRLGFGWDAVHALNPRLVYCSISAFGQTGPYRDGAGYDLIVQGEGGVMSVTGEPEGRPMKLGPPQADIFSSYCAAFAIVASLLGRTATGEGRYLDVAMLDNQIALLSHYLVNYQLSGRVPTRTGTRHPLVSPYQSFPTATADINVAILNNKLWQDFCAAVERPDLAQDSRFTTQADRLVNRAVLEPLVEEILRQQPADYWLERLHARGVPCGVINTVDRVMEHPQVRARRMLHEIDHPAAGRVEIAGIPWRVWPIEEEEPLQPSPTLGQHTDEILRERLGYTSEQITDLRQQGVV